MGIYMMICWLVWHTSKILIFYFHSPSLTLNKVCFSVFHSIYNETLPWAVKWQNQQRGCAASENSLSAWKNLGSLATHWVHSEDSDQTGWMPRLIWVFAGLTLILLVLSWGVSHYYCQSLQVYCWKIQKLVTVSADLMQNLIYQLSLKLLRNADNWCTSLKINVEKWMVLCARRN